MSDVRILDAGPLARLVEVAAGSAAAWAEAMVAEGAPGVVEVVPAARTVLIRCADRESLALVVARIPHIDLPSADRTVTDRIVEIPVVYDGDDLDEVALATGLDRDDVVARHAGSAFRVEFCGFAPGFAYLSGLDELLRLPRRPTPRTRVPAGSVAIADGYSAVYPGTSPGGWHLIGHTELRVWDVDRSPPALLEPGTEVRFVAR
ncbi:MAG: 5-oxoprolinase subunit B family protein [Ilumatobacteraceae bacterium]